VPEAGRIAHWFDDPEVRARLGGREWLARQMDLVAAGGGEVFGGSRVLRCHAWTGIDPAGEPVGLIIGDVYDRLTEPGVPPGIAMGLAFVVDPARKRQGYGRSLLTAVTTLPEAGDVEQFLCGVEKDNLASRACCAAAGFRPVTTEPDAEGLIYYRRPGRQRAS
jgi:RimJ/RimL family protein N-acetyltransferase